MGYIGGTADFDTAVIEAGDRFVSQVQPVLHPRSLAVVLLNSEGHPGQAASPETPLNSLELNR